MGHKAIKKSGQKKQPKIRPWFSERGRLFFSRKRQEMNIE
jgi:hypothetical protein